MRDPSGLKAAEFTPPSWPRRTAISLPVAASQMRAVLSVDAVTMRDPSGLKAAEVTVRSRGNRRGHDVRCGQIVLQKSFRTGVQNSAGCRRVFSVKT
jgi:hypothetical protein